MVQNAADGKEDLRSVNADYVPIMVGDSSKPVY